MQIDLSVAYRTLEAMATRLLAAFPRFLVGAIVLMVLYYAGSALRWVVLRGAGRWRGRENLELAMARILHAAVIGVSVLVAATIAFPSFTAGSLIQLLGVTGIAFGFAFKDIFQNFLAGILLLITEPFDIGDQIVVDGFEGTVETIHTRATLITTYDNRRVVVPNADLFTKSVTVNTAFSVRRMEFDVAAAADADVDALKRELLARIRRVSGVAEAPAPDVLLLRFDPSTVTLRLRWWCAPGREASLAVQDRVLTEVRRVIVAERERRSTGGTA
jgi:small conductance mechanosensitive channel